MLSRPQGQGAGSSAQIITSATSSGSKKFSSYPNIMNSPPRTNTVPAPFAAPQRQDAGRSTQSITSSSSSGPGKGRHLYPSILNTTQSSSSAPGPSSAPHRQTTSGSTQGNSIASGPARPTNFISTPNVMNPTKGNAPARVPSPTPQRQNNPTLSFPVSGQPLASHHAGYHSGKHARETLKEPRAISADELVWYCSDCLKNQRETPPLFNLFPSDNTVANECRYSKPQPSHPRSRTICKRKFDIDSGDIVQKAKDAPPTWVLRLPGKIAYLPWSKVIGQYRTPWTSYEPFRNLPINQLWPDWYCCQCKNDKNANYNYVIQTRSCGHPHPS
jgi:hypothetical protein